MSPILLVWNVVLAAAAWIESFAFDFVPSDPAVGPLLDVNSDAATFPEEVVAEDACDAVALGTSHEEVEACDVDIQGDGDGARMLDGGRDDDEDTLDEVHVVAASCHFCHFPWLSRLFH